MPVGMTGGRAKPQRLNSGAARCAGSAYRVNKKHMKNGFHTEVMFGPTSFKDDREGEHGCLHKEVMNEKTYPQTTH